MIIKVEARIRRDALKPALTDPCYSAAGLRNVMYSDCLLPNLEWLVLLLLCSTAWMPSSTVRQWNVLFKDEMFVLSIRRAHSKNDDLASTSPPPMASTTLTVPYSKSAMKLMRLQICLSEFWKLSSKFWRVTSRCEYSLPPVPPYSCSRFEEKQRLLPPLFQVVEDDKTLGSYDIEKIKSFYLVEIGTVQIFVKTLLGETLSCWMSSGATVKSLKEELEAIEGLPIGMTHFSWFQCILRRWPTDNQRIIFAGKSLEDSNASLLQYNVEEWSTLHLVLRLRGGGTLSDDLTFARVCREWNGDMASVVVNGAQGVLFANMKLVLWRSYWSELGIQATGHHYQKDRRSLV